MQISEDFGTDEAASSLVRRDGARVALVCTVYSSDGFDFCSSGCFINLNSRSFSSGSHSVSESVGANMMSQLFHCFSLSLYARSISCRFVSHLTLEGSHLSRCRMVDGFTKTENLSLFHCIFCGKGRGLKEGLERGDGGTQFNGEL